MTTTTTVAPAEPSSGPARPDKRPRDEGQWALGQLEPLNDNERIKAEDNPLNVRSRIESTYAAGGFASIDKTDLRGRFRWWGLYTQRRPGIDGGRTATLPPEDLEDEHFMLRIRVDGGALTTRQLATIGSISSEFARDTADITDRQNIQLHWVRIEDMPEIWRRLEAEGLSTTEACGDCPRVILGSPVAGVSPQEVLDASGAIDEIERRFIGDPTLSNLPRKLKTAISWLPDTVPEIQDIAFLGVIHPEYGPGFDLLVGGGLATNPMLAVRLGAWVPLEDVPDVWSGVVEIFRDYGYRRLRNKARLKFLVADWGPTRFREVLETEYLHRPLIDGPVAPTPERTIDHVGVHPQRDGRKYVGLAPIAGRVSGTTLQSLARAAESAGSQRVRLTPRQKVLVLDVPDDLVAPLIDAVTPLGLYATPSTWRRSVMACTGLEFCKLAIVDTKDRARDLVTDLEVRLAAVALEHPIAIHLNGCPNSCARIQVADIGLKGQIVTDESGDQVEGFQVHLGGELGLDPGFGKKLRGHKVASRDLGDYVERVVVAFSAQHRPGERFAQWVARADEGDLR